MIHRSSVVASLRHSWLGEGFGSPFSEPCADGGTALADGPINRGSFAMSLAQSLIHQGNHSSGPRVL